MLTAIRENENEKKNTKNLGISIDLGQTPTQKKTTFYKKYSFTLLGETFDLICFDINSFVFTI